MHTLNEVQLKKDSDQTPYELWYGYNPNVSYLKESRKGKVDVKDDEGIFLGYSYRSKAYKCLNLSTHKIIESAHVRIDEFAKKSEEESKKEPGDYRRIFYYEPDTLQNLSKTKEASPPKSPKSPITTEL